MGTRLCGNCFKFLWFFVGSWLLIAFLVVGCFFVGFLLYISIIV